MAKRFTDTDKWKDEWFSELSNDYKVIWYYLLDTCDNAGIYKRNIKLLNYACNTNVSAEDILEVFGKRICVLSEERWFIKKFCIIQYGNDFLNSTNKAVLSAVKLLEDNKIIEWTGKMIKYDYGKEVRERKEYTILLDYDNPINTQSIPYQYHINTQSIPYQYPIDTPKEKEKEKVKGKEQILEQNQEQNKVISYGIAYKLYQELLNYELPIKTYEQALEDWCELGSNKDLYSVLNLTENEINKLNETISIRLEN